MDFLQFTAKKTDEGLTGNAERKHNMDGIYPSSVIAARCHLLLRGGYLNFLYFSFFHNKDFSVLKAGEEFFITAGEKNLAFAD